jgi:hypothetical protein
MRHFGELKSTTSGSSSRWCDLLTVNIDQHQFMALDRGTILQRCRCCRNSPGNLAAEQALPVRKCHSLLRPEQQHARNRWPDNLRRSVHRSKPQHRSCRWQLRIHSHQGTPATNCFGWSHVDLRRHRGVFPTMRRMLRLHQRQHASLPLPDCVRWWCHHDMVW